MQLFASGNISISLHHNVRKINTGKNTYRTDWTSGRVPISHNCYHHNYASEFFAIARSTQPAAYCTGPCINYTAFPLGNMLHYEQICCIDLLSALQCIAKLQPPRSCHSDSLVSGTSLYRAITIRSCHSNSVTSWSSLYRAITFRSCHRDCSTSPYHAIVTSLARLSICALFVVLLISMTMQGCIKSLMLYVLHFDHEACTKWTCI